MLKYIYITYVFKKNIYVKKTAKLSKSINFLLSLILLLSNILYMHHVNLFYCQLDA